MDDRSARTCAIVRLGRILDKILDKIDKIGGFRGSMSTQRLVWLLAIG